MNTLQVLLEEFKEKIPSFNEITGRNLAFPDLHNKIFVAMGMRRTGKTYFLLKIINDLLVSKIPLTRILYINFEDDRLFPLTQEKLRELLDGFYTLYPENHDKLCYFFLDEIQNVEDWPLVIRRYLDTKKIKIYLTGSSAKLLSREIATSLRGRSFPLEVWPFSFDEYLHAKQTKIDRSLIGQKTLDKLKKQLVEYLNNGGFPEVVNLINSDRTAILQDYVNVVVFRDVIERHKITNITLVKYLLKTLLKNSATLFSVNKLCNDLKSQGFNVSKNTIHDYLSFFEDAYLVFSVPLYAESIRKMQTNPRKNYVIDTGLVNAYTLGMVKGLGHLFENLVYLDLRRRGHEIYYYLTKTRKEVDFLTKDKSGKWHLYQVAWNMDDKDTLEREVNALQEAESELKIKGEIITPEMYLRDFNNLSANNS